MMSRLKLTGAVFVLTLLVSVNADTPGTKTAASANPPVNNSPLESSTVNVVHTSGTSLVKETTVEATPLPTVDDAHSSDSSLVEGTTVDATPISNDDSTSTNPSVTNTSLESSTMDVVNSSDVSFVNDTASNVTTNPAAPPSDAAKDPARLVLPILQRIKQFLPVELQDAVNRMEPLDDDEVRMLLQFVEQVKGQLGSLPANVRADTINVIKAIEDTGILDTLSTTLPECKDPSQCPNTIASPSDAAKDPNRLILPILQQIKQFLPGELQDAVNRMEPLDDDEVRLLLEFVEQVKGQLGTLPANTRVETINVIKAIEDTGIFDTLNMTQSAIPKLANFLPPYTDSWPKCQLDVLIMLQALNNSEMWALNMVDAMGKPGRSILKGNFIWPGNNDQCTSVHYKNGQTFSDIRGRTCKVYITVDFKALVGTDLTGGQPRPIQWDACLPHSCESGDLIRFLYEREIYNLYFQCTADLDMSSDVAAVIAIIILAVFGAMVVVGSLVDLGISFESKPNKPKDDYIINAYSNGTAYNGTVNQGFELKEAVLTKPSTIEIPVDHMTSTARRPVNQNGIVLKRLNGKAPDMSEIPEYAQYQAPNGIGHNEQRQMQQQNQKNNAKGNQEAALPRWQRALLSFSIQRNTGKIFSVDTSPGTIGCLHGIRVLSLAWVILGHLIIFGATSGQFENSADIFSRIQTLPFQIIINGPLSVDTFFFMSGFLTCYLFLKECAKTQKVTIKQMILYYVHRYWRLTPPFMIWVMIEAALMQYVGEGKPGWVDSPTAGACRKNWWANLLYINSVYDDGGVCVGVSWFLSNDMMFYIIAPLVMIPWVYRQRLFGFAMALVLIGIHVSSNIWLITKYNFDLLRQPNQEYSKKLYFKPYTRVAPFAIGLIFGYIMHKAKGKLTMNKWVVFLGWLLALGAIFTISLVTYDENGNPQYYIHSWSAGGKAAYETIARPMWAVAIGWMVLACASGYGGFINSFLAWPGWQPLSRLTYGAYLVHLTIMSFEMYSLVQTYLFTDTTLIYLFAGYYFFSYVIGYLLCITVESPMLGLEKAALK